MSTMAQPQSGNVSFNMAAAVTQKTAPGHAMANKVDGIRHVENGKLILKDLNFFYGKFQGLHNINVNYPARQVTAMIGPSGCGKSTLLRTLNRIYDLYPGQRAEGEIVMDGQNLLSKDVDLNQLRAKIGMVFQKPTPFPMSIYDNIAFGVKLYENLSKSEMNDRVEWALRKGAMPCWAEVEWGKAGKAPRSLASLAEASRPVSRTKDISFLARSMAGWLS